MGDLLVDTEVVAEAGRSLRTVYQEFKDAGDHASPGSGVLAHDRLRDRLEEFADNWDDKRQDMTRVIEGLGEIAEAAAEAFEELEDSFVAAMEGR